MADPKDKAPLAPATASAPAQERKVIKVRALQACTTVDPNTGRHYYREAREVFDIFEDHFNPGHMARGEAATLPPGRLPPPTTLPAHMQPRPVV